MSSIRMMSLAVLSCLALVSPAHADKTTGQTVDDSAIATEVKAKLVETKGVPSTAINVEVSKGRVQLGGFLETNAEKSAALAAAKSVSGVTKVSRRPRRHQEGSFRRPGDRRYDDPGDAQDQAGRGEMPARPGASTPTSTMARC